MHKFWKNHQKKVDIMKNKVQKTSSQLDNYSWSYDFLKMQDENEMKIE